MENNHSSLGQPREIWQYLKPYGKLSMFARHTLVYTPSESAQSLYLLVSGQVNLYMISSGGRVLSLQLVERYHIFGHSVLTGSEYYDTFAETLTATKVIVISREDVFKALRHHPSLGLHFIEVLEHYHLAASRRLEALAFKSVPARLASVLLDMSHGIAGEQHIRLPRRTHQQLADMTNAYRETVTKVIRQFRTDRLVDVDRTGITILNKARLRELARG